MRISDWSSDVCSSDLIVLGHGMSGEVLQRVMDDELDAGFYLSIPSDTLTTSETIFCKVLTRYSYKVLAPAGWESQVRDKEWRQLAGLPWLATPTASAHHRLLAQVLDRKSTRLNSSH